MALPLDEATEDERRALVSLALGRIFRLASRPFQEGDLEAYWEARDLVVALLPEKAPDYTPSFARDRHRGAQGE